MDVRIEPSWKQQLQEEFDKPYFEKLVTFVKDEYKRAHVLPLGHQIFHIFNSCPFEKVKVVILGQDPYPNPGQYYGVCFSRSSCETILVAIRFILPSDSFFGLLVKPVQNIHRLDGRQRMHIQILQLADDLVLHDGIRRKGKQIKLPVFL